MNSRSIVHKTAFIFQNLLCGAVFVSVGAAALLFFLYPAAWAACAVWIASFGPYVITGIAVFLIIVGFWLFSSTVRFAKTQTITYAKGTLRTSLGRDLFRQTITKLWQEYFKRSDLSVSVSLRKRSLVIFGQVPEEWNKHEDLAAFLSNRLLTLTGYWGDIFIHSTKRP